MARSKDVYTILGYLCVDPKFREQFFAQPEKKARQLVGSLTHDEIGQIQNLAGLSLDPYERAAFVKKALSALQEVCTVYNCPVRPCPDPDDDDGDPVPSGQ